MLRGTRRWLWIAERPFGPQLAFWLFVGVFLAREALAAGAVTRYELAARHRRLLPGVYAPQEMELSLRDRIAAAWLWSEREGVICGAAAAALHGARWIPAGIPIEIRADRHKAPPGVVALRDTLADGEVVHSGGSLAVTSLERTAFDLARKEPRIRAIQRLDDLCRAVSSRSDDVLALLDAHPKVRGRRRVPGLLDLVDPGSQSPQESWVRMLLIDAGFPRPQTQIPVLRANGYSRYHLDMGWEDLMVGGTVAMTSSGGLSRRGYPGNRECPLAQVTSRNSSASAGTRRGRASAGGPCAVRHASSPARAVGPWASRPARPGFPTRRVCSPKCPSA